MSDALEETLKVLHKELAEEFLRRVRSGEASPADLNSARQFLRDNGVDSVAIKGSPLMKLAIALPFDNALPTPQAPLSLPLVEVKGTMVKTDERLQERIPELPR